MKPLEAIYKVHGMDPRLAYQEGRMVFMKKYGCKVFQPAGLVEDKSKPKKGH